MSCKFKQNSFIGNGGILSVSSASSLLVEATDFSDTSCTGNGGHTYVSGCNFASFERQCTTRAFSDNHGQSTYITSTSQANYTLCSISSSPNNTGGSDFQWGTLQASINVKTFQSKVNISHCDFPVPRGKGGIIRWQADGSGAELGTFADNRLSKMFTHEHGKATISSSNVVNNSDKGTAEEPGLFCIYSNSDSIECTDTLFINNHFKRLLYSFSTPGDVSFKNSFFYGSSFSTLTEYPTAISEPSTRLLEHHCEWDNKEWQTGVFTPQKAHLQKFFEGLFLVILCLLFGET